MNVLLVSPYRGKTYETVGIHIPPLGLLYIAGALQHAGHQVELDLTEKAEISDQIDQQVDVVGITSTTSQFTKALEIARVAHEQGKTVIMGGPHPTSSPDEVLRSQFVNYVVRGEGETTAVELLQGIQESNGNFDPASIQGISWYDPESNTVINNTPRPWIQELDDLPYPLRNHNGKANVDMNREIGGAISPTMITTRGCPYNCSFCDVHVLAGKQWRTRSHKSVVDEMEHLVNDFGAEDIRIMDDIINHDNEAFHRFMDTIIERDLNISFWVMGRADMLLRDPSTAEKMARTGVRTMFMGIETPSSRVLKTYHKGGKASADTSASAVELLRQHGIDTYGGFIVGEPSETAEEIEATIDYAKFVNPATAQFSVLTPYPGTAVWEQLKDRLITDDWDKYDGLHAVFDGDHLSAKEIEAYCRKAYMKFYLRPGRIANHLFSGLTGKAAKGPRLKTVSKIFNVLQTMR
jgi:anaerobic magnesium-protoporphyrin IX monomethyl ester cyclase